MRYWPIFVSLFFAFPAIGQEPKGQLVEKVVAVVNDKTILLTELQENVKQYNKVTKGEPASDKNVLDQLINQLLVEQEIIRRGLSANEGIVDGAVAQVMKQNGMASIADLTKALKAEGLTLEDYRASLKKQIETSRLMNDAIRSKIQISDQDILAEYRRMNSTATENTMTKVQMIFKKKGGGEADLKTMQRLVREINAGVPFEKVADRETDGPGKGEGGSIGFVNPSEMQPEIARALKDLKPGEISKPIQTPQGIYIVKCVEITKAKSNDSMTDKQKEEIREKLTDKETERAFENMIRDLRTKSHIEVLL